MAVQSNVSTDARIGRTAYGWSAVFMALPFLLSGAFFALAGGGFLTLPGKVNAPLWVIAVIGLAFFSAGSVLGVQGLVGVWSRRRAGRARHRVGAGPWFEDYPWNPGGVDDDPHGRWVRAFLLTGLVGLIIAPLNWWGFLERDTPLPVTVMAAVMDGVWLLLALHGCYLMLRAFKYGRGRLSFRRFPLAPGDTLEVGLSPNRFDGLEVHLRYVRERFEGQGRGRRRNARHRADALYSERQSVEGGDGGAELMIRARLPDTPGWTTRLTADPDVSYWELEVRADRPGIDYLARFPLPVYDGARGRQVSMPLPPLRASRWPIPFELALPGVLSVLLLALFLFAPRQFQTLDNGLHAAAAAAAVEGFVALRPVGDTRGDAMDVAPAPDGSVWTVGKYAVHRFDAEGARLMVDPALHREQIGGRFSAYSAGTVDERGRLWLGTWKGALYRFDRGRLLAVASAGTPIKGRIQTLLYLDGAVWVAASNGVWRLPESGALEPVEALPAGRATALAATDGGTLAAAVEDGVWERSGPDWRRVHHGRKALALAPRSRGGWWLGHRRGAGYLDAAGFHPIPALDGQWVRAMVEQNGRLWVGTWGEGLWFRDGDAWHRIGTARGLPTGKVSDLSPGNNDDLWMALYGEGFSRAHIPRLQRIGR
ncbi:MAG: hypothetical protein ACPGU7_00125 [Gammaproteobacteria bacterium]